MKIKLNQKTDKKVMYMTDAGLIEVGLPKGFCFSAFSRPYKANECFLYAFTHRPSFNSFEWSVSVTLSENDVICIGSVFLSPEEIVAEVWEDSLRVGK